LKRSKNKQFGCTPSTDKEEMFTMRIGAVYYLTADFEQEHNREEECLKFKS